MMAEQQPTRHKMSTPSLVASAVALAAVMLGYGGGSAILLFLGILAAVAGLSLGIAARREASITISAVTLLGGLAMFFGLIG